MPRWVDDNHPLVAGMIVGALQARGINAEPLMAPEDERRPGDDYTPSFGFRMFDRDWIIDVKPAQPRISDRGVNDGRP